MSHGVNGLHACDVKRKSKRSTTEGSTVKEEIKAKSEKVEVYIAWCNGLHAGNVDGEREANY